MLQTEEDVKRRRVAENWSLRRRQAKLHAEFEFLSREVGSRCRRRFRPVRVQCVQLCHKRFLKPSVDSIELSEIEEKFLKDLKERKLKEVVTKQCLSVIKFLMSQKVSHRRKIDRKCRWMMMHRAVAVVSVQ